MSYRQREVAKFFAGAFAYDAIVHVTLAVSGVLPLKLLGVTVTPVMNVLLMIAAASVSLFLAYHGWIKPERPPFAGR